MDLVAWAFYSPRRLLGVVAGLLLALILAVTGAAQAVGGGDHGASAAPTATAEPSAAPTGDPAADEVEDRTADEAATPHPDAVKAATGFVKAWLKGPTAKTPEAWLEKLRPFVSSELYTGLQQTDPARIPPATIGAGDVGALTIGDYLNELSVPLEGDRALVVTLAFDGSVWRVIGVEEAAPKPGAKGP